MKHFNEILLAIFIFISLCIIGCQDESITFCPYYDLCDSVFYVSFQMDTTNFYHNQEFIYESCQRASFDTTAKIQDGAVLITSIYFFSSLKITFSKTYKLDEYEPYSKAEEFLSNSFIRYLPQEKAKDMYADSLKPAQFKYYSYEVEVSNPDGSYIRNKKYAFPTDGVFLEFYFNSKNYYGTWLTFPKYFSDHFMTDDSLSYFVINKLTYYKDTYYLIEGRFKLRVYDEFGENSRYIDNGKFKLVVNIPSDNFDYSDFWVYSWTDFY